MTAITTPKSATGANDSFLRFALAARRDLAAHRRVSRHSRWPAGWRRHRATPVAFEYGVSAFFIAFGMAVFALAAGHR